MKPEMLHSAAVQVKMFGGFSITIGDVTVSESDSPSKKAWLLLQYLIAFQKREISTSELVNILWPDTELSSPSGSLKSLVFRARKLLTPLPVPASELLIQQNGVYRWNPALPAEVDSRQFDEMCSQIFMEQDQEKQISLCLKAMDLYRGEFLPNSSEESWVIPVNTYYASLFLKMAHLCMELYMQREAYSHQIALCRRVLALSPYDETAHYNLIYSLYLSGNQIAAVNHYQAVINSFYNHPGEFPPLSDSFTALYKIISSGNHAQASDIDEILSQLSENTPPRYQRGAYFCEYAVFKDLCRVTIRSISRAGGCAYLCLFSLTVLEQRSIRSQTLSKAMDSLCQAITTTLRKGDVFCRYSSEQYLLLLPVDEDNSQERAKQAVRRIMKQYRDLYPRNDLLLEYSLKQLDDDL